jgi:hypothetical protein
MRDSNTRPSSRGSHDSTRRTPWTPSRHVITNTLRTRRAHTHDQTMTWFVPTVVVSAVQPDRRGDLLTSFAHDAPLQSGTSLRMSSFGAADLFSLHWPRPSASFGDHAPVVRGRSAAAVVPTTSHDPAANNKDMFEWSAATASESSGRARQLVVSSEAAPSGGSLSG